MVGSHENHFNMIQLNHFRLNTNLCLMAILYVISLEMLYIPF